MKISVSSAAVAALLVSLLAPAPAQAQCRHAQAEEFLDVNNVRARVVGDGFLVYRTGLPAGYEVPKGSGIHAIYSARFILGSEIDGVPHVAASRWAGPEYWPGPLPASVPADSMACDPYDRLFELTRDDLLALGHSGQATPNVTAWPWHLGAPVVDGDGNPNNYAPLAGDRPALLGDQMFWWIMNDRGGEHASTGSAPLGVEVRGSAFAHNVPGDLENTVFYRFEVSSDRSLRGVRAGLWLDGDLGTFDDDYHGSDTLLHLGYFYNEKDPDGYPGSGYGTPAPALGAVFLEGPEAAENGIDDDRDGTIDEDGEQMGLSSFLCIRKRREGRTAEDHWLNLNGMRVEGDSIRVGGHYSEPDPSTPATQFCYPGDPVTGSFWSAENLDGNGARMVPHDLRFQMNMGPFDLEPGQSETISFALVWVRGDNRLDSVSRVKQAAAHLRESADAVLTPTSSQQWRHVPEQALGFMQNYPNPVDDETVIQLNVPRSANVRLDVVDVLGRTVAVLLDGREDAGEKRVRFQTSSLPPGLYQYRYTLDQRMFSKSLVIVR